MFKWYDTLCGITINKSDSAKSKATQLRGFMMQLLSRLLPFAKQPEQKKEKINKVEIKAKSAHDH